MSTENRDPFIYHFNLIQEAAYRNSVDHGFHDRPIDDGTRIALMHSELSECLEALRHDNPPDDHIPDFSGAEAELADVIIRIMDFAQLKGFRLGEAVLAKHRYNYARPYRHGKSF